MAITGNSQGRVTPPVSAANARNEVIVINLLHHRSGDRGNALSAPYHSESYEAPTDTARGPAPWGWQGQDRQLRLCSWVVSVARNVWRPSTIPVALRAFTAFLKAASMSGPTRAQP